MKAAARLPEPEPQEPTPEMFLEEIQRIVNSGTLEGTREVAERGLALFPDHAELKRLHHALRPFEKAKIAVGVPTHFDPTPNFEWLKKNWSQYPRKWVALDRGELVAVSDNFKEVHEALQSRDPRGTLLHYFIDPNLKMFDVLI